MVNSLLIRLNQRWRGGSLRCNINDDDSNELPFKKSTYVLDTELFVLHTLYF